LLDGRASQTTEEHCRSTCLLTPSLFPETTQSLFSSIHIRQCYSSNSPLGDCGLPRIAYKGCGSKFGKIGDVSWQLYPEIPKIISSWALESFVWEPYLILFESLKMTQELTPAVSIIAKKKKHFPASHAFVVYGMGCQDLIG